MEVVIIVAVIVIWLALQLWILPRFACLVVNARWMQAELGWGE